MAVVEVCAVFVLMHVTYRALKAFTPLGRLEGGMNFLPGLVMIAFSLGLMRLHGRSAGEYGLTSDDWRIDLKLGVLWGVAWAAAVGAVVVLGRFAVDPRRGPPTSLAVIGAAGQLVFTALLLVLLRRERGWLRRMPVGVALLLIATGATAGPIVAAHSGKSVIEAAATVGWILFGAGVGEEVFFRGYVMSRVDLAFRGEGRRRVLGTRVGPGLLVSALLFGAIHAINRVDYFRGQWDVDWGWGVMNVCCGLFYGVLRARRGGIWAGVAAHGLSDVLLFVPAFR